MNDNFKILRWRGIKNDKTRQTEVGYLYIEFLNDVTLLNISPNVIGAKPHEYKKGQEIGFTLQAKNRKQAIYVFGLTYQVCH